MIRFGGSPYASHTPQTVVTVVQIITAWRIAAFGAAASIRMMTSVRIVSPIIDTPSRMPGRERDDRRHGNDRRQNRAAVAPKQKERDPLEHARLRDDGDEERQAEDEEHRVGVNQLVEPVKRQHVLAHPRPPSRVGDLTVPLGRFEPEEGRHDDERHAVGQRVLVNLVFEGAEHEQAEDRGEQLRGEKRHRQRRRRAQRQAAGMRQ